jgi:hypothetical protein
MPCSQQSRHSERTARLAVCRAQAEIIDACASAALQQRVPLSSCMGRDAYSLDGACLRAYTGAVFGLSDADSDAVACAFASVHDTCTAATNAVRFAGLSDFRTVAHLARS